jgi:hypothetical protein
MLRPVKRAGFDFSFSRVGITPCGLCQGHFTVEVGLLFGAESEGHAAGGGDSLEHSERVAGVLGILQPGDHGLRRADLAGKFGLSEAAGGPRFPLANFLKPFLHLEYTIPRSSRQVTRGDGGWAMLRYSEIPETAHKRGVYHSENSR